ncbi:hypothetical protein BZB76_2671 [Actinomadura pelletieri DSM 43383]|uniref:Uncharacterized protein n=1 Tax=Actinomadura pelletieri DSM 43383 TaxID=1120940 RepID=A0A495QUW3_9ACTN|nr:DUF6210 family protein [Actinomadura pelletieri]RKS77290.1 hypothetical protein BZB76_2671 [Actinomadura pelletieri DSM 43383]
MRFVFLDPDGGQRDWLYVVVGASTGIVYQQQYGGTANLVGEVEGYLVPIDGVDHVSGRDGRAELREIFEGATRGSGRTGAELTADRLDRVRSAVGVIHYWTSGRTREGTTDRVPLRIDESRVDELDEAWIPVHTPDGPGVLVWDNSD